MKLAQTAVTRLGLLVYGLLLLKVVLFKVPSARVLLESLTLEQIQFRLRHAVNLRPFKTITYYLSGDQSFQTAFWNLAGNVAIFTPLGFLLPLAFPESGRLRSVVVIAFVLSLVLEGTQAIWGLGSFDVDDVLLNVLGAVLGWIAYRGVGEVLNAVTSKKALD